MTREQIIGRALTIPGWYDPPMLEKLWALAWEAARSVPEGNAVEMLEIGTWKGRSAYVLGHVASYLYCMDTWKGVPEDPENRHYLDAKVQSIELIARANLEDTPARKVFIKANSVDALPYWEPEVACFVHIDGDHSSPTVDLDVFNGWRIVSPGGILCGDDYAEPDVTRAVEDLNKPYEVYLNRLWWVRKPQREN